MLCLRGEREPWDRVGTLIRNKNLESNFLTLGIRFQYSKFLTLGKGFEFKVTHQTENFKPSKVKNMCLHLTRLFPSSCCSSERQWGGSALFIYKIYILIKLRKQASI